MSPTAKAARCCTALNVSVAPNEIVAVMGRNGMGKTTLMKRSLMGIVPTRSGIQVTHGRQLELRQAQEL